MKTMLLSLVLLLILGVLPHVAAAQTQVVKGVVKDRDADFPLPGVNVYVENSDPFVGAVTDLDGRFRMEQVPIGRITLVVKFIGYKTQTIPNVLVTSGKETVLNIELIESVESLGEVVITADADKDRPINEMAKVSARTFSMEEVTRYSGGRNDVARLASNFAGVSTANDARNDIVVRGNSPTGLLWRVEGLPVPTTNHFATLGTTGGPVSALNTNLLRTSDFLTGAFPAEYGNANAAVFDVKYRNGNRDKHEYTLQMSAFSGLEAMAEGPLNRKNGGSYLVSYRYGIASVAATGTSAIPYYQDLNFKINLGESKLGRFELFGMGGLSSIDFIGTEIDENDLFANPNQDAFVKNRIGAAGVNHVYRFSNTAYLKTTIGATLMHTIYEQDNYVEEPVSGGPTKYRATDARDYEQRYTVSTQYNKKYNARFNLRTGLINEVFHLDNRLLDRDRRVEIPDANGDGVPDFFTEVRRINSFTPLTQGYAQGEYKYTDDLSFTAGLHSQYFDLTGSFMVAPRAAVSWQARPRSCFSVAYGLHGQLAPLPILLLREEIAPGVMASTNANLDFTKSHHFVAGYDYKPSAAWRIKTEVYYQRLFNIPIEQQPGSYAVINEGADFVFDERGGLVNKGTGFNYGAELTVERFFSRKWYMLATTSVFDSRYTGSDGVERSTAFNNRYVFNVLGGKEWPVGEKGRNAITFDTKFTTSGGRPFTPIDLEATRANGGRQVLMEDIAYSERYSYYLRWDVKFGLRLNSPKGRVSHQFFVDLQNVTNRENVFVQRYNPVTDAINTVNQIGFFPDFMYRLQF
jgi:hypothetical protein